MLSKKNFYSIIIATPFFTIVPMSLSMFVQLHIKELGGSPFLVSLQSLVFWLGLTIFCIAWGKLSDLLHKRKLLIFIASLFTGLSMMIFSFLHSIKNLIIIRFFNSIFIAGFAPIMLAYLSERAGTQHGRVLSIFNTSQSVGFAIGSIFAGFILQYFDFKSAYLIASILPIITAFIILGGIQETKISFKQNLSRMSRIIILMFLGIMLRKSGVIGIYSLVFVYLKSRGIAPYLMGILSFLNPLTQIIFMPIFGRIADKYERDKLTAMGVLTTVLSPICFLLGKTIIFYILGFIFIGLSFAMMLSGVTAYTGYHGKGHEGTSMGLLLSFESFGGILGPFIAGLVATLTNSYQVMFACMAGLILIGFIFCVLCKKL